MALYALFAGILDYPGGPLARIVDECAAELALESPEAHAHIVAFQDAVRGKRLGELEEIYINAFDLRPDCTPNLGYHLFGNDGRRGLFLAELKGRMESSGIVLGCELPDHISLLLRYMQQAGDESKALIEDCILPALSRMTELLDASENLYKHALHALLSLLQRQSEAFEGSAEAMKL